VRQVGPGWLSLVLTMDPGRLVIDVPAVNGGGLILARFCQDLSVVANQVAVDLGHKQLGGGLG
jgi:hypothetical protein